MIAVWLALAFGQIQLDEVLDRVDARVPQLAAAQARIEAAEAELLAQRGVFDPTLVGEGSGYAGAYSRSVLGTSLESQSLLGPEVAVGYRLGQGDFPAYAGDDVTGSAGEWVGRVEVPLLQGLGYGAERAALDRASRTVDAAVDGQRAKAIELRAKASAAYWKWVAAGASLSVYEELLEVAQQRRDALELQVEQGQRARIDLLDNERVLLERTAAVAEARGEVERAAVGLSLYYRDETGAPIVPSTEDLPEPASIERSVEVPGLLDVDRRPDVAQARALTDIERIGVRGARNGLLPELSASVEQALPVVDGDPETIGGVALEFPLFLRSGRGELAERRARLSVREQQLRGLEDLARAEIEAGRIAVEATDRQLEAATGALDRAREVARLERRRFELGGVELFTLLQREERVARAGLAQARAYLERGLARAELERAIGGID